LQNPEDFAIPFFLRKKERSRCYPKERKYHAFLLGESLSPFATTIRCKSFAAELQIIFFLKEKGIWVSYKYVWNE
jgi:hypothetical protein